MSGRYLLDSNIVIASLSSDPEVIQRIEDADEYFVSATILGEMLYGALHSANSSKNVALVTGRSCVPLASPVLFDRRFTVKLAGCFFRARKHVSIAASS